MTKIPLFFLWIITKEKTYEHLAFKRYGGYNEKAILFCNREKERKNMKRTKKFLAAVLAGVMVLGMSMVALAADNDSPAVGPSTSENFALWYGESKAKISAGAGTLAEITDETTQQLVMERELAILDYVFENFKDANGNEAGVWKTYAFDVQGIASGEVSVELEGIGDLLAEMSTVGVTPTKALVSHYNETTKEWETCWSDIKMNGNNGLITFKFDSYSPILVAVTDATTDNAGKTIDAIAYTDNPTQVKATSPNTADQTATLFVLFGAVVVAVAAVSRKRFFA